MVSTRKEALIAIVSLLVGSLATPILYLAFALLAPRGFMDLRNSSALTLSYYFGAVWAVSALVTLGIGGIAWWVVHRQSWDGVLSYSLIAASAAVLIGMFAGTQNWMAVAMGIANAITVRALELRMRRTPVTS